MRLYPPYTQMTKIKATQKTFLVSDESKNGYGFRVLNAGLDVSAFERNPVMLYMHQRGKVFGAWSNLVLADGAWTAEPVFDEGDPDGLVQEVLGKVARGFLRAASIGIEILEVVRNEALACYDVTACVLQEISIVDVGGNRNAVRLYAHGQPLGEDELAGTLATLCARTDETNESVPITINTPVQMELKEIAQLLGLPETASGPEVQAVAAKLAAESGYKEKFDQLSAALAAAKVKDAEALVDAAIADKRIGADQKGVYARLFAADYDSARQVLAQLARPVDLVALTAPGSLRAGVMADVDAAGQYDALDHNGRLAKLKAENPDEFKRLFVAKWGREPK